MAKEKKQVMAEDTGWLQTLVGEHRELSSNGAKIHLASLKLRDGSIRFEFNFVYDASKSYADKAQLQRAVLNVLEGFQAMAKKIITA